MLNTRKGRKDPGGAHTCIFAKLYGSSQEFMKHMEVHCGRITAYYPTYQNGIAIYAVLQNNRTKIRNESCEKFVRFLDLDSTYLSRDFPDESVNWDFGGVSDSETKYHKKGCGLIFLKVSGVKGGESGNVSTAKKPPRLASMFPEIYPGRLCNNPTRENTIRLEAESFD